MFPKMTAPVRRPAYLPKLNIPTSNSPHYHSPNIITPSHSAFENVPHVISHHSLNIPHTSPLKITLSGADFGIPLRCEISRRNGMTTFAYSLEPSPKHPTRPTHPTHPTYYELPHTPTQSLTPSTPITISIDFPHAPHLTADSADLHLKTASPHTHDSRNPGPCMADLWSHREKGGDGPPAVVTPSGSPVFRTNQNNSGTPPPSALPPKSYSNVETQTPKLATTQTSTQTVSTGDDTHRKQYSNPSLPSRDCVSPGHCTANLWSRRENGSGTIDLWRRIGGEEGANLWRRYVAQEDPAMSSPSVCDMGSQTFSPPSTDSSTQTDQVADPRSCESILSDFHTFLAKRIARQLVELYPTYFNEILKVTYTCKNDVELFLQQSETH